MPGKNFFYSGNRDVQRRQLRGEPYIALALDQHDGAGIGGHKICSGDAGVGFEKFLPQHFAGKTREFLSSIERQIGLEFPLKELGNALTAVMKRRADKMRRL